MNWVTREKVKVDRVACPWLIRKFIDPDAVFLFLPKETDWSTVAGEGLRWIAHGFSRLGLTDHEMLDREFIVYDALYLECQQRLESQARQGAA